MSRLCLTIALTTFAGSFAFAEEPTKPLTLPEIQRLEREAAIEYQKSSAHFERREFAQALAAMERCVSIHPKQTIFKRPHPDYLTVLVGLGVLCFELGELDRAETNLRQALELRPKCMIPPRGPPCVWHHTLALVLREKGASDPRKFAEASQLLEPAATQARLLAWVAPTVEFRGIAATIVDNLGMLKRDTNDRAGAVMYLSEALERMRSMGPAYPENQLLGTMNNLAIAHEVWDNSDEARKLLEYVVSRRERLHAAEPSTASAADLASAKINLAHVLYDLHVTKKLNVATRAEELAIEAVNLTRKWFKGNDPDLGSRLQTLAMILQFRGYHEVAEKLNREAVAIAENAYPAAIFPDGHSELARARHNLAFGFELQNRPAEAVPLYQSSLQSRIRANERFALVSTESAALEFGVRGILDFAVYLSATRPAKTPAEVVYSDVWAFKSGLMRVFERRHAEVVSTSDPNVRRNWTALIEARQAQERLIWRQSVLLAPIDRGNEFRRLGAEVERLERELGAAVPSFSASSAKAPSVAALQAALPDRSAFIDVVSYREMKAIPIKGRAGFFQSEPHYDAFVVRRDGIERVDLGPAMPIDQALANWRKAIDTSATANTPSAQPDGQYARELRTLVWDKLAAALPTDTSVVYISPDGALAQLPWAGLPGRAPGTILLEDLAIAIVPHGPYLLRQLTGPKPNPTDGTLLAIGGIEFGEPADGERLWSRLDGSTRERENVARLAGSYGLTAHELTGTAATRARLLAELPGARVAHLSTHGFFANEKEGAKFGLDKSLFEFRSLSARPERIGEGVKNPLLLTGLALAGANEVGNAEGLLTAASIVDQPLEGLDLAFLSACETGLGESVSGEGVFGLQRAFHVAGCRNVVASLWKVDDEATAALATLFYRNLWERNLSPVESLRLAQLTMYRAGKLDPRFATVDGKGSSDGRAIGVRDWAAFTVSGVGPVTGAEPIELPPEESRTTYRWWIVSGLALIVLLGIVLRRRALRTT